MAITRKTLAAMARLRADVDALTDAQTRDLVKAWADAFDTVREDLDDALVVLLAGAEDQTVTRAQVMRSNRLMSSLVAITEQLTKLAEAAGVRVSDDIPAVVTTAGRSQLEIIASQLPASEAARMASWSQVSPRQIEAIVTRSTQQITAATLPLSAEASQAVRTELVRGIAVGSNPRQTAARMVQRVERRFNGGLTRALVISRTETLDAHNTAARMGQSQNTATLAGWVWLSALTTRTCPSCFAKHGSIHPLDEPGPDDHQQGRCTRMPKTRPWRELGIDLDEPADLTPDAGAVFGRMTVADQRMILGPKRYQAWKDGTYPMESWTALRSTPGWRDSWHVSPAPV